jgi:N6-adenosine-specific RNA methylase IME4
MEENRMVEAKKYNVVYADPPWRYDFSKSDSREIEGQYHTMSLQEICALNIPTDENAVLYLWATAPKMLEAFEVMKAWGFEYKTHAVWDKETIGMGYWFRGQHEILMVGVKGQVSPPEPSKRIGSVIRSKKNNKHSAKPVSIREQIKQWFPDAKRLELFARSREGFFPDYEYEGWDVYGNQVNNSIVLTPSSPSSNGTMKIK